MTRLWAGRVQVRVVLGDDGLPVKLVWDGRTHPVAQVVNGWRVEGGWWRLPVCREYLRLITTTGRLLVIYHDGLSGTWHVQRVYD